MLSDQSSSPRIWTVLATKSRKEDAAALILRKEAYEVYCPKLLNPRLSDEAQPLFPGYLFAWLSPKVELPKVRYFPCVLGPVTFGGQVASVGSDLVDHWKAREGGRGYLSPEPKPPFRVGQEVRFKAGAFAGLVATVLENLPARDRVRVLLDYLGGTIPVEADRELLA